MLLQEDSRLCSGHNSKLKTNRFHFSSESVCHEILKIKNPYFYVNNLYHVIGHKSILQTSRKFDPPSQ